MSKITVIISLPGNNVVFYQVQYQVNLTTILNNQFTRINTFSTKLAVIGCFTCQIYGNVLSTFLDQDKLQCGPDLMPSISAKPNSWSSGSIRLLLNCLLNFESSHSFS